MKRHVDLLGILHIIWGALSLLIGLSMLALTVAAISIVASEPPEAGSTLAERFVAASFMSMAIVSLTCGAAHLWEGFGLRRPRDWARTFGLVLAVLNLLLIPFGTALGVYTLWVLLHDDARALFRPGHP